MKNKKNIYFLLPAVLLIWGLLGYRIYSTVKPKKTTTNRAITAITFKPNEFKESEPFIIKTDYRDPFLGKTPLKKPKARSKVKTKPKPNQPFPQIVYKGVVSGSDNKQQVFIIGVAGRQYFFRKDQTHQGIKLISGNLKSITVKFEGQQQNFSISK